MSLNLSTLSRYSLELVSASSEYFFATSVVEDALHRAALLQEKRRL